MENNSLAVIPGNNGGLTTTANDSEIKSFRLKCQAFAKQLNTLPPEESIGLTPDKKAKTVYISHIETTLDEYFFGLWETENFHWQVIANEIVGSLELVFYHPVTGIKMRRTGAAAIQIMVDKAPDNIIGQDRNKWALDTANKKSNALDMGFPKLKAECLKNAANSLGKMFGRDLNRDKEKTDEFKGLLRPDELPKDVVDFIELQIDPEELDKIYDSNPQFHSISEFFRLIASKKQSIKNAKK